MDWFVNLSSRALWRVASRYGYLLARHRRAAFLSVGAIAAEYYLNFYKNRSYDRTRNGEDRLVELLELRDGDSVFDVGAHHGDYARYIKTLYPAADVHCFELSPGNIRSFRGNEENTRAGLELHEFGLGESAGEFEIFESQGQSQIVSLHAVSGDTRRATGRIRRGDQFCAEVGINRIAFLKVDTEGNDLEVLRGFADMLAPRRIECIQFEYNECSVGAGVLLNDFFQLLEPAGYTLGKIYPRAVEFGPYSIHLEDHRANNYCAVGKGSDLESRLAGRKHWGRGLR
jgi:FkbM family methyltransferase